MSPASAAPPPGARAFAAARDAFWRWHEAMEEWERDQHADPNGARRGGAAVLRQSVRLHQLNDEWLDALDRCTRALCAPRG